MIRGRLPMGVYKRAVTVVFGTVEEFNAVLAAELTDCTPCRPGILGRHVAYEHAKGVADYLFVARTGTRDAQLVVLAHECFHHVAYTLMRAGMRLSDDSEEAFAYYLEWTMEQCMAIMYRPARARAPKRATRAAKRKRTR